VSFYDIIDAQRINVKIAISQFVPNFVSYVSAKYYLNWFIVGKVIAEIKRVNFSETQCSVSMYVQSESKAAPIHSFVTLTNVGRFL